MTDDTRRALAQQSRRLLARWQPGCFVGTVARVIQESDDRPAHFVGAAWPPPPSDGPPERWPDAVVIASPSAERALLELLAQLPSEAPLHLVDAERVDFGLAVEIARTADRNLQPWQHEALGEFLARWREAEREAIAQRFTDRDEGFERFISSVTGAPPGPPGQ